MVLGSMQPLRKMQEQGLTRLSLPFPDHTRVGAVSTGSVLLVIDITYAVGFVLFPRRKLD